MEKKIIMMKCCIYIFPVKFIFYVQFYILKVFFKKNSLILTFELSDYRNLKPFNTSSVNITESQLMAKG